MSAVFGWCNSSGVDGALPPVSCDQKITYVTILQTAGVVGMAVGSLLGGRLMQYGRRSLIIISDYIAILFSVICIVQKSYTWVVVFGRLGYGFAGGLMLSTSPKFLDETVPPHLIDKGFGSSTNISISVGIFIMTLLGLFNANSSNYYELLDSANWQVIYGFAILPALLQVILLHFVFKEDSPSFNI